MAGPPLNPTALQQLSALLRPDWARTVLARRIAAGALVVIAATLAFRPDPAGAHTAVVVAIRDLPPGMTLTADDVRIESRSTPTVPDGAHTDIATVVGATLAGPTRRGEMLTDVRTLGPRLAESAAGKNARIVPVPLADSATVDMVRPGDVVDIITTEQPGSPEPAPPQPTVLATDAVVVVVSPKPAAKVPSERVVLVALPLQQANRVAAVALVQAVTLTFR